MEVVGAFFDEEWELLSKMFSCGENPNLLFPSNGETPSENIPFDHHHPNFYCISEESSNASDHQVKGALFSTHEFLDHHNVPNNNSFDEAMNFHNNMDISNNDHGLMMMPVFSDDVMQEILYSKDEENDHQPSETGDSCKEMQLKRKSKDCSPEISPKKTPRVSRNKNQSKKKKKMAEEKDNEEERKDGSRINIRQSSSSCSSEDDSNATSQELINGGSLDSDTKTLNSNAKSKTRGSATDPQSLYARRRREKINERLRILQNLVPNGTKVDISTMLEEAVTYVKFLQLQIKLLSSDDLWMYAPLAYNGMDIGIYQNISPNLRA